MLPNKLNIKNFESFKKVNYTFKNYYKEQDHNITYSYNN